MFIIAKCKPVDYRTGHKYNSSLYQSKLKSFKYNIVSLADYIY